MLLEQAGLGLSSDHATLCVLEGEVYDAADARATLVRQGIRVEDDRMATLLVRGVWLEGRRFFERMHGSFALAVWSEEKKRLTLVNDRFGLRPVYYVHAHGRLTFASEIGALLQDATIDRAISPTGLGQFMAFGHFFGDATFFDAVRLLPRAPSSSATLPRIDSRSRGTRRCPARRATRRTGDARPGGGPSRTPWRKAPTTAARAPGLSLSGGLDARTILAAVPSHVSLTTVSLACPAAWTTMRRRCSRRSPTGPPPHMLDQAFLTTFERTSARWCASPMATTSIRASS